MARVREGTAHCDLNPPNVSEVRVETRALVTVGPESPIWHLPGTPGSFEPGAIFRLVPPPGCPDAEVDALASRLREAGAARVKVVRQRALSVLAPEKKPERSARASAREVVMRMAEGARTADRPALVALLDARLSECGL